MKGKIKWFDIKKGYGFITPEDGSPDVYIHAKGIESGRTYTGFNDNDEVEFEVKEGKRGTMATGVTLVNVESAE